MSGLIWRVVASLGVVGAEVYVARLFNAVTTLAAGQLAVGQLENSDASYIASSVGLASLPGALIIPPVVAGLVMVAIWYKPLKSLLNDSKKAAAGTMAAIMLLTSIPAQAFYDVKDRPEYIEIQPNQSAFLIPLQGANKNSQKQYMSESYLIENKVASKRIQIPHVMLESGVATERNHYIPAAKLIVVDRTPYNREWAHGAQKGTSATDQSISFESRESVEGRFDVAISAFVKEEDAAKFLYFFGTSTAVNPADPNSNFSSIANGKSLAEVMDNNVRMKVQACLAREYGARTTIDGISNKAAIMDVCEKEIKESFKAKGITVDFMGYASGITFSKEVQASLDNVFTTALDEKTLPVRLKVIELRKAEADIALKNSMGVAMQKWNGQLPFWFPTEIWAKILSFFHLGGAVAGK
jgi:hypothetical protein